MSKLLKTFSNDNKKPPNELSFPSFQCYFTEYVEVNLSVGMEITIEFQTHTLTQSSDIYFIFIRVGVNRDHIHNTYLSLLVVSVRNNTELWRKKRALPHNNIQFAQLLNNKSNDADFYIYLTR